MFLTIIITIYLFIIHLTFYDAPSDNLWLKFLYNIIIPFIPFTILYLPTYILYLQAQSHAIPTYIPDSYTKGV